MRRVGAVGVVSEFELAALMNDCVVDVPLYKDESSSLERVQRLCAHSSLLKDSATALELLRARPSPRRGNDAPLMPYALNTAQWIGCCVSLCA